MPLGCESLTIPLSETNQAGPLGKHSWMGCQSPVMKAAERKCPETWVGLNFGPRFLLRPLLTCLGLACPGLGTVHLMVLPAQDAESAGDLDLQG